MSELIILKEIKALYYYYKHAMGIPKNWDVKYEEWIIKTEEKEYPRDKHNCPIFDYTVFGKDEEVSSFTVIDANTRVIFTRNDIEQSKKIEIDVELIRIIRIELMNVIRDIHDRNYGSAMKVAENIREKISWIHIDNVSS